MQLKRSMPSRPCLYKRNDAAHQSASGASIFLALLKQSSQDIAELRVAKFTGTYLSTMAIILQDIAVKHMSSRPQRMNLQATSNMRVDLSMSLR